MTKPTRQELYDLGLPAPAAKRAPLLVESVDIATGRLFYASHGLALDALVSLRIRSSSTLGAPADALPGGAGLAQGVTYYARPTSSDALQLATAPSPAAAIASFTNVGAGKFAIEIDPGAGVDAAIERAWSVVQEHLTGHAGDVDATVVHDLAAALAIRIYCAANGAGNPVYAATFAAGAEIWREMYAPLLAAWIRGKPVRQGVDATPKTAEMGAESARIRPGPFGEPPRRLGATFDLSGDRTQDLLGLLGTFDVGSDRV